MRVRRCTSPQNPSDFNMFNPRLYSRKVFGAAFAPPFSPLRSSIWNPHPFRATHSAISSYPSSSLFVTTPQTIRPYSSRANSYRNLSMQATGSAQGGASSTSAKNKTDDPKEKFLSFLDTRKTVVLATTAPSGEAHASAVPFVHEGHLKNLYVVRSLTYVYNLIHISLTWINVYIWIVRQRFIGTYGAFTRETPR